MIHGVLFDVGETLLTSLEPAEINRLILKKKNIKKTTKQIEKAMEKAENSFGKKYTDKEMLALGMDKFYVEWDNEVFGHLGIDDKKLGQYAHKHWFDMSGLEAFDDAVAVLNRLSASGLRLGVVSNGYEDEIKDVLKRTGIDRNLFTVIVGRDTAGALKPDPRPFVHAAGSMGLRPDEVLFVGDKFDKDYEGAMGVGMTPVLLLRGKSLPKGTPKDINIAQTLDEIVNFIR